MSDIKIVSDSAVLTKKIAKTFIADVLKKKKGPHMFLLKGDLGSGKTAFVLGALSHFGIRPKAASPTFVLMKHYKTGTRGKGLGVRGKNSDIYHVDAYRLRSKKDFNELHVPGLYQGPASISRPGLNRQIVFIEWPEQVKFRAPKGAFIIKFSHGSHISKRIIEISRK
ncbi:tRNA (adenosine(37)-N6)-threonylcarbamoyltransferase complex ATPase subunit type 1 TsaE [Candidatus Wolfebacteria bacterium RIFCSPHIGHO2_01_FULL_48_22]|uniref:tRNA threonylcarbamoyladenosine biosynthesis protein TsaE n=2 Tax=Candidatus Wolfeibacteriota TaxID=1752735 RepID=A0A1F8DQQ9_9BACT|nr:MAG: tRNA (adenosine(37)-N6)-threonylcarbamoyltransferase complex ATPase subunit type 1 TsaE [Candidatus Wolfebacteria bacterium RIFCSPHIGHO2_01_FULL_48_22]OGM93475.1 MAG: tRNA (adenosine(37)-N6)-threonylcarbamoyltransferase complex ATPase subunit type 1 TsaE [Candidatus Wolfebacteria bacterium RIFCSPLOWO2_01_FULL_47_17b]